MAAHPLLGSRDLFHSCARHASDESGGRSLCHSWCALQAPDTSDECLARSNAHAVAHHGCEGFKRPMDSFVAILYRRCGDLVACLRR